MKHKKNGIFLVIFIIIVLRGFPLSAQENTLDSLKSIAVIEQKVMVPMRDGIRLATDIYRPKTDKPVPVILSKTPYNFNTWQDGKRNTRGFQTAYRFVKHGYAYVVQNERGRYFSEGKWEILGPPTTDGFDAIQWLAEQPWSNGKVGLIGCSSTAEWQMAVAALDPPGLAAIVPMGFGAGIGRMGEFYEQGNFYRGGVHQMLMTAWLYDYGFIQTSEHRPTFPKDMTHEELVRVSKYFDLAAEVPEVDWSKALRFLPLMDIVKNLGGPKSIYEEMIKRKPNDPAWYKGGLYHDHMSFGVPALWFISWYDISVSPNLALVNHVISTAKNPEVAGNQFAVIAPVCHCAFSRGGKNTIVGERNVGDAQLDIENLIYPWFDYWLKGEKNGILEKTPKFKYYTMGLNKWQSSYTWPPENAETVTFYLTSKGQANSLFGNGKLTTKPPGPEDHPDTFTYDPDNPVPTHGGGFCCMGDNYRPGSFDQRQIESRYDILVYSTDPLKEGVEISGTIEITLYVSSDVKDTDFTVKLVDVYPDGRAYNLDDTIQRVRYRQGYDQEVFMEKGKVYKLPVSSMSTSNYFAPDHRIRIEVSSSNFPRYARNLNTGGNNFDEKEGLNAHNKVHHSKEHPSQIRVSMTKGIIH
ncbi:MAG: CocE/NonD family hydrolase [Candidatus Aminicenantes bacterium]|nr:CocE/NonD family hydrolase [Candidatus Aminicenantes bacterium]